MPATADDRPAGITAGQLAEALPASVSAPALHVPAEIGTGEAGRRRRRLVSRERLAILWPGLVLVALVLAGRILPLPFDPTEPDSGAILLPPGAQHWFGTDGNGIDVFSRVLAAGANDIPLALAGAVLAGLVGVPLGLVASRGDRWSSALMRGVDLFQSIPLLVVALTIVALAGSGSVNVLAAIALINVPVFIRITRARALVVRTQRFMEASAAMGARERWLVARHLLRNVSSVALTQLSISGGYALLMIAALGFLGLGVQPTTPSWGIMLNGGAKYISGGEWWAVVFPIVAIVSTVLAFNALAAGVGSVWGRRLRR